MDSNIILHLQKALAEGTEIDLPYIKKLSKALGVSIAKTAGVASFYAAFNKEFSAETYDFSGHTEITTGFHSDYAALPRVLAAPAEVLELIKNSGLLGRSGSGFPLAEKWRMSRDASSAAKYVVCNGSEGEGDTYKDLVLLTHAPHAVIEGMAICAEIIGAHTGFIYIRHEYDVAYESVRNAVMEAYERGVLGNGFDILIRRGAGAYVCGEETALLEFLEGKRGETRLKPPYPGVNGLYGCPTVINNVESFAFIPAIILGHGHNNSKLFTVSGCVERPGVYECTCETTIGEIFKMAGGEQFKGLQIGGGASGAIISSKVSDIPLTIEDCANAGFGPGTGSLMFFNNSISAVEICAKSLKFMSEQACGKCAPCRLGTARASILLEKINAGQGRFTDIAELKEIAVNLKESSRCGLGTSAATPILTALEYFGGDFDDLCRNVR